MSVLVSSHRAEMKDQKVKVGAVHAAPIYMKKIETLQKVVSLIDEAGKQNVELLAFPEVFVPGFPVSTLLPSRDYPDSLPVLHQLIRATSTSISNHRVWTAIRSGQCFGRRSRGGERSLQSSKSGNSAWDLRESQRRPSAL